MGFSRQADADGAMRQVGLGCLAGSNALGHQGCLSHIGFGQDGDELLPAEAAQAVDFAQFAAGAQREARKPAG